MVSTDPKQNPEQTIRNTRKPCLEERPAHRTSLSVSSSLLTILQNYSRLLGHQEGEKDPDTNPPDPDPPPVCRLPREELQGPAQESKLLLGMVVCALHPSGYEAKAEADAVL